MFNVILPLLLHHLPWPLISFHILSNIARYQISINTEQGKKKAKICLVDGYCRYLLDTKLIREILNILLRQILSLAHFLYYNYNMYDLNSNTFGLDDLNYDILYLQVYTMLYNNQVNVCVCVFASTDYVMRRDELVALFCVLLSLIISAKKCVIPVRSELSYN